MPVPEFIVRPVADAADWDLARAIREEVFIGEQECPPAEEWDEFDEFSRHFLGWIGDLPVATARWRTSFTEGRSVAKLERFAVLRAYRGHGYGRQLVAHLIDDARQAGFQTCYIHAQVHLEDFYRTMGFNTISSAFVEAGIPHVAMLRKG